jgi:hypothetical protein
MRVLFSLSSLRVAGVIASALAVSSLPGMTADAQPTAAPRWEVFANCAAAYEANWQSRMQSRAPSMSSMIKEESDAYRLAAVGYFEKDKQASNEEANKVITVHLGANVERFVAMDKAGTLEAYIEACPQLEDPN